MKKSNGQRLRISISPLAFLGDTEEYKIKAINKMLMTTL